MLASRMLNGGALKSRPVRVVDQLIDQWSRRELLITATRVLLAGVSVLAIGLDPSEPAEYADFTYAVLLAYTGYALLPKIHVWTAHAFTRGWPMTTHVVDIVTALSVVALTGGSTSPFFGFLLFPLLPSALRWRWRGTLLTAVAVSAGLVAIALRELLVHDPHFGLSSVILRLVYMAILTTVLGIISASEEQSRQAIVKLAMWAPSGAVDEDEFHAEVLGHVADTLAARRVLLSWRAQDAETTTLVEWSGGVVRASSEDVATWETAVAKKMRDTHFLCTRASAAAPRLIYVAPDGLRRGDGSPVGADFRTRFSPRSIVSFRLRVDRITGRLFILDKPRLTIDDLMLGALVAHQVENSLEHRDSLQRLRDATVSEERARLARDVHDEVLQSMAALSLGLETVGRLIEGTPERAREWLAELQVRLSHDQRALRASIQALKRGSGVPSRLAWHLVTLVETLEQEWGLPVKLDLRFEEDLAVPDAIAREIRLIVREGIVNVARHARASAVYVAVSGTRGEVSIKVEDDGRGFPFTGTYDDAERRRLALGPVVLAERVEALGGALAIVSSTAGARLEIGIPLG
jgi:signal transduction histidine kinase